MRKRFEDHNEDMGLSEAGAYSSEDIMTVFNMVTHDTGESRWDIKGISPNLRLFMPRQAPQLMKECITALFFLRCLQAKNYFCSPGATLQSSTNLSNEETYIALLLHHFMRVVFYNSHEVGWLFNHKVFQLLLQAMQVIPGSGWQKNKVLNHDPHLIV